MALTREVAEFVACAGLGDVPSAVRELAKRSILDGLGLAVAGARSRAAAIARAEVGSYGALSPESTALGIGDRLPARFAAFLNGLAIHADDYDDTQLAVGPDRVYGLLTHPTAPALPAVLALAERRGSSGSDVLLAYTLGVEVETKVAEAIDPRHYNDGFHSTATMGSIGAGAGAARVLGLDTESTAIALGIAASTAAGLRENFGTMTKPLHAGRAAENGVVSASLAAAGFTAATNILEARRGFFHAAGGGFDRTVIEGRLGAPWTFAEPGISIKPHPSGSLTHPAMGAFLDLVLANDLRPGDVRRVRVGTNRHMPNALIHHRPTNELEAKFSMEFCMVILLLERKAGLAEFTDEVVNRPDVKELIERVAFEADPAADEGGFREMTSLIDVELVDGRVLSTRAEFGKGSPANPMKDAELVDKFLGCLDWGGVDEAAGREVAERVLALEDQPSLDDVIAPLAAVPSVAA
ncbi:MAG TPA: MmgE/PrpD family protein [Candidatus Limnocylindrales bacterium]|nr:MmgE/PrpD family protein [Candidatus Limnocylindrales bacterium]